jgi:hypothetical protein
MEYRHVVPYPAIGCSASGGYAWGYAGGYVWGFRIPQLACKFPRKYKALADRSPGRINPDSPLGATPLGLPISPSVPDSIFRRFIVPSQIATHHHGLQPDGCCRFIGGTAEMEEIVSG